MEFSKFIGISKSSVNMYERGEREPNLETLEKIADFFAVDMDYLHGKTDSPRTPAQPRPVSDDDIKFALFGGSEEITDAMYEEVKQFAAFVKNRGRKD
jgi:transcriptional regulator with XRE-family HTH domain